MEGDNSNIILTSDEPSPRKLVASKSMCHCCFDALIDHIQQTSINIKGLHEFVKELPDPKIQSPLFVTWEKRTNEVSNWQLRGCIGCLYPRTLATDITEYAVISGVRDRRFNPIVMEEVPFLRVSVSLLVDYETCKDVYDWTIGIHGILIKFTVDGKSYDGTFLPEVAKEQGWDHATTVSSLIRKAGYRKNIDQMLLESIRCTRYQSSKCPLTYTEYRANKSNGREAFQIPSQPKKRSSNPWYKKFAGL